jgi:hypothetical protein
MLKRSTRQHVIENQRLIAARSPMTNYAMQRVIASEANQSNLPKSQMMDCFVAPLLAMTVCYN